MVFTSSLTFGAVTFLATGSDGESNAAWRVDRRVVRVEIASFLNALKQSQDHLCWRPNLVMAEACITAHCNNRGLTTEVNGHQRTFNKLAEE